MKYTKKMRIADFYNVMQGLGLNHSEIEVLRRAQMTLHRWNELECGSSNDYGTSFCLNRDEESGKPFMEYHYPDGRYRKFPYPDKEKGALNRIKSVLSGKNLFFFHQTDPRGCALYLLRDGDVPEGREADQYYSRGVAVCY